MNVKKITALMLAGTLCVSLFAGCSTADSESQSESGSETTSGTTFTTEFDLSSYLTEDGFVKDVKFDEIVELADYKNIVIPKEEYSTTQEEIDAEISYLLSQFTSQEETVTEGIVPDGATLNIDYVGSVDGVEFEGGSTGGAGTEVTIGVTNYIDDFLQQLVGKEIGSNFDIEVTFPENYHQADLAGKDAIFNITINHMLVPVTPELTDDFVKTNLYDIYGTETVDQLNDFVEQQISQEKVNKYVYNEIISNCVVKELPEHVLKLQQDYILANMESTAQYYGMGLDDYLTAAYNSTREDYLTNYGAMIEGAANELVIFQAIAEKEGLKITKEDVDDYFGGEDYSTVEKLYGMPFIKFLIVQNEVLNMLENDTPRE